MSLKRKWSSAGWVREGVPKSWLLASCWKSYVKRLSQSMTTQKIKRLTTRHIMTISMSVQNPSATIYNIHELCRNYFAVLSNMLACPCERQPYNNPCFDVSTCRLSMTPGSEPILLDLEKLLLLFIRFSGKQRHIRKTHDFRTRVH